MRPAEAGGTRELSHIRPFFRASAHVEFLRYRRAAARNSADLLLDATTGSWNLKGGAILGGTVDARAGVTVIAPNGFTQGSVGTFTVEVAGDSNNGLVSVTGAANLAGTLNIDRTGGYVPANGSSFTVMTYGSSSGGFSSVTGTDAGGGSQFVPNVGATSLVLDVM